MKRIVLENLRSAYNVGNIVRTADALGRGVVRVGYTARADHKQVRKTSLGAEESIPKLEFNTITEFLNSLPLSKGVGGINNGKNMLIVAELTQTSIPLTAITSTLQSDQDLFLVVGNEVTGVEPETIAAADAVIHIPMQGIKESLNVGQAAAICMWELSKA